MKSMAWHGMAGAYSNGDAMKKGGGQGGVGQRVQGDCRQQSLRASL